MPETLNQFVEALSAHDGRALRDAFERANERAENKLHRTTLTRWLDGSVPTNGDFIQLLAEELDDDDLVAAWESVRGSRSSTAYRSVVTRFDGLSAADRTKAYAEIRRSYLATQYPKILERLSYRVEINDGEGPAADGLVVRLTQEYDSWLDANAQVRFCTTQGELGDAYEEDQVIFREILDFDRAGLDGLLTAMPDPVLTYNQLDGSQTMITPEGRWLDGGVYEFANGHVENARVRLDLEYPLPTSTQQYFIRFGKFRVAGGAEFKLTLHARSTSAPSVFPFLPAGRHREWAANLVRPNELVASIGAGGTILADGDGLVLFWLNKR